MHTVRNIIANSRKINVRFPDAYNVGENPIATRVNKPEAKIAIYLILLLKLSIVFNNSHTMIQIMTTYITKGKYMSALL